MHLINIQNHFFASDKIFHFVFIYRPFKAGQENATIWDASYEVTAASAASSEDSAGTTNLHSNFTYSNVTDNTNVASSYIPNNVELQDNKENVQGEFKLYFHLNLCL